MALPLRAPGAVAPPVPGAALQAPPPGFGARPNMALKPPTRANQAQAMAPGGIPGMGGPQPVGTRKPTFRPAGGMQAGGQQKTRKRQSYALAGQQ